MNSSPQRNVTESGRGQLIRASLMLARTLRRLVRAVARPLLRALGWRGAQLRGVNGQGERIIAEIREIHARYVKLASDAVRLIAARRPSRRGAPISRGVCIVRTQGRRIDLMAEAIASVEVQSVPMQVLLVTHGNNEAFSRVKAWQQSSGSSAICLHAGVAGRRRGYPANVGLDYISQHAQEFDFLCFLDDDDILYPYFASRMAEVLDLCDADLVYAQANQRDAWQAPKQGGNLLPPMCLLGGNFIVMNSFALRVEAWVESQVFFSEEMEYLEDWHFLLKLLDRGVVFEPLFETLSEYRLLGDGNASVKKLPLLYSAGIHRIEAACFELLSSSDASNFYADVSHFDFSSREPLTSGEVAVIEGARKKFEMARRTLKPAALPPEGA
ncbi:hypothetical protein [Tardiphaga sp. OK246]|uniref:hypothetical protein n=1 Tax=Tardiphaga sp. OK246 TaxID=1855307 RepID=UPI001131DA31|nr:hypothetical protein [Tardiphaga sp. OK246]